jgi:hypothetical protein
VARVTSVELTAEAIVSMMEPGNSLDSIETTCISLAHVNLVSARARISGASTRTREACGQWCVSTLG